MEGGFLSCAGLQGDIVFNKKDEALGRLEHIMIDAASGTVAYAVLARGGVFGLGEKLFAIPWAAFTLDPHKRRLLLDVECERLDRAWGFDPDDWPLAAPENDWLQKPRQM